MSFWPDRPICIFTTRSIGVEGKICFLCVVVVAHEPQPHQANAIEIVVHRRCAPVEFIFRVLYYYKMELGGSVKERYR